MCYKGTSELPYWTLQLCSVLPLFLSNQLQDLHSHLSSYFLHCLICSEISFFSLFSLQFSLQALPGSLFMGKPSESISGFIHILFIFINILIFIFWSSQITGFQHLLLQGFFSFMAEHSSFCGNILAQCPYKDSPSHLAI